jgi:hypothetical protein
MTINANQWHKSTEVAKQHVDENKHLYGSASISKIMSKGTGGLEGTAYVGRIFKNLGDVLHVKFARLLYRFSEGEWVNNKTIRKDLNNKIDELTDLVKGPKHKHLSEEDKALVKQGIAEMQAVCSLLKERGVKDMDSVSRKLDRALPGTVIIPEGLEEKISSQKKKGIVVENKPVREEVSEKEHFKNPKIENMYLKAKEQFANDPMKKEVMKEIKRILTSYEANGQIILSSESQRMMFQSKEAQQKHLDFDKKIDSFFEREDLFAGISIWSHE